MRRLILTGVLFFTAIFSLTRLAAAGLGETNETPPITAGTGAPPATPLPTTRTMTLTTTTATTPKPMTLTTPTVDRLAAPPTVYPPTQADEGAQLFWLYCQPCHGDQGQGLTDEWRAQYPPEHQNCWGRGCHAESPYPEGFTLPTRVPAVIGEGSLNRFQTVGQLYHYIRLEMPYEYPGRLTDEEYLALAAFLARAHEVGQGQLLTAGNVQQIRLHAPPGEYEDLDIRQERRPAENPTVTAVPATASESLAGRLLFLRDYWTWIGIALFLLLAGGSWLVLRRR